MDMRKASNRNAYVRRSAHTCSRIRLLMKRKLMATRAPTGNGGALPVAGAVLRRTTVPSSDVPLSSDARTASNPSSTSDCSVAVATGSGKLDAAAKSRNASEGASLSSSNAANYSARTVCRLTRQTKTKQKRSKNQTTKRANNKEYSVPETRYK